MIGKKVPKNRERAARKSKAANIRDLTNYIADPGGEEKIVYANGRNFIAETPAGRQVEMIALAEEAPRSRDPVAHYILSWREGEQPSREQAEQAVTILLEELGLVEHQAVYGLHRDTDNIHLHVAVNRVHPESHRVVKPNKGFDIEATHRAVARIEAAQGWERERNARYMVETDGRVVRAAADGDRGREPSQRSRDYEQRTGAKSAERIAIEEAAPVLRDAGSWAELHERLEALGMRLERKGSGALLWVGEQAVKPSSIDRAASLGALEKRLGSFEPRTAAQPGVTHGGAERDEHAERSGGVGAGGEGTPGRGRAEPGPGGPAAREAPRGEDDVRQVQARGVVDHRDGTSVLLPRDVPGDVVGEGAAPHRGLRRDQDRPVDLEAAVAAAVPVLRDARSWDELHTRLADQGVQYERKGSGGVLRVGEHVVRASTADRRASLGALEKRLGPFAPAGDESRGAAAPPPPRPPRPLRASPPEWAAYMAEREEHYKRKAAALAEQRNAHEKERLALRDGQRERREELLGQARTRVARQALRSVIAAEHAGAKADLRDRQNQERHALRKQYGRFPDLEEWLRARRPEAADQWRYRAQQAATIAGPAFVQPRPHDIRAFTAAIHGAEVYYHRQNVPVPAPASFIDRGRAIQVRETYDRTAVLASLQLAAQKWGRFQVHGSETYKALCTELAVEHGFRLDNPELQRALEAERARVRAGTRGEPVQASRRPPIPPAGSPPPPDARERLRSGPTGPSTPHVSAPALPSPAREPLAAVGARPPPAARGRLLTMAEGVPTLAQAAALPGPSAATPSRTDKLAPLGPVGTRPPPDARGRLRTLADGAPTLAQAAGLPVSASAAAEVPAPPQVPAAGPAAPAVPPSRSPADRAAHPGPQEPPRMAPSTSRPADPGPAPAPGAAPRPAQTGEPLVPPRSPLAAFDAYHAAVQAERYRVTAIAMRPDGTKMAFILDKKDGVTLGFTPDELRARARELERLERRGENLYYTPLSSSKHHLLVDDMNREKLERLIRDGFRPAALLESSPGNYQAIITLRKLGSDHDRDVGNRLSLQLNREYGDPNLSGAIHPHRAPGFSNHKPKHRRADGSYPEVILLRAEPRECEHTLALSRAVLAEREAADRRQREQAAVRPQIAPAAAESTVAAYYAHHGDVSARLRGDLDASRVDAMIAVRLRATGHAPGAIADAVERCAPTVRPVEKQTSHDWALYAQRTVQYAYGPAGEQQFDQTRRYHEQWRRLERDAHRPTVAQPATPAAPGRDPDNTPDL